MLSPGSIFAGYQIERVLGGGGMGTVYLARNADLPRGEALKVLNADLTGDHDFRARFIREAEVAAGLDHPNIVSIHQRGEFDGQLWIAMQFVDGTDANAALRAGTMTPARAVHIVGEVAKALDYAHQRGVVHRDIKPANFLLSGPVGPDERVLLGDFGIARALDDAGLTDTGSVTATVAYAAPEVLAGQPFDGRADLYSLACTLFRLLTGRAPYPTVNGAAAVVAAHLHAPPPKVTDVAPGLSAQLDQVIATAMAKDPAQRFTSARALADAATAALNEHLGSTTAPWQPAPQPDNAPPWGTGSYSATAPLGFYRPPPPPPRRRPRLAAVAAAVVTVVAAVVAVVVLNAKSRAHQSDSPPAASSTTSAAPSGPLNSAALTGLLLSPEQVAGMVGAAQLVQESFSDAVIDDSEKLLQKDCIGVMAPAQHLVYADAGWTGVRSQALRNPGEGPRMYAIIQAVISFPTVDAAKKLLADQQSQWASCSGRTLTVTFPTPPSPQLWAAGTPADMDGVMTMTQTLKDGVGMQCQRALAVRNNVAVDVSACRFDVAEQALDIVRGIAARIPG
ncbi:serine/threonine-protein kinase PknH/PknJ [Candidatus Mycobacterium wuenschmannii]|uniref:non-specific serine/threonine protein kinase n=1 Tax=Candidatus Mycobacterium wuenschmannii TaxID=3027808 RepID=A0ABY8VUW8_9MYCO|nr:serine/threonine-protein kinase PknH/PknJ [Candidatus Mycobacterium wuenschmannii]WIM87106.1 serine/threonine-protein kinase PknH/PknJ [Candidatus Mycobacterium wuenschmannii]